MTLAALSTSLRDTSERFGGIGRYLKAAGDLDRACSAFFREQDLASLQALTGAVARAEICRKEVSSQKGPKAV